MRLSSLWLIVMVSSASFLAGCADKAPDLMNLEATQIGPDEFAILPTKPLEAPKDYAFLPAPTPGLTNKTDPTPHEDAIVALGGSARPTSLRGQERAMVAAAARHGVDPEIRESLAAADLKWRKQHRGKLLERLFGVNVYYKSYEAQALNQHLELERLRRLGIWTPAAPPNPAGN